MTKVSLQNDPVDGGNIDDVLFLPLATGIESFAARYVLKLGKWGKYVVSEAVCLLKGLILTFGFPARTCPLQTPSSRDLHQVLSFARFSHVGERFTLD